ncbi:MAG: hypothetical protein ACOC5E_00455, partial [Acidobacteriota bacterium]
TLVLTFVSGDGIAASASREIVRRVDSAHRRLLPELRRKVLPVAVSVDGAAGLALVGSEVRDPDAWLLLSGPTSQVDRLALPLEVVSWTEDGRIAHTLRTVVVAPDLRIADIFPGTAPWTEPDLRATLSRWARE